MKRLIKNKKIIILLIILLLGASLASFFIIKDKNKSSDISNENKQNSIKETNQEFNSDKTNDENEENKDNKDKKKDKDKNTTANNKNEDKNQNNNTNNKKEELTTKPDDKNQNNITSSNNNQNTTNNNKNDNNSQNTSSDTNKDNSTSNDKDKDKPNNENNNNSNNNSNNSNNNNTNVDNNDNSNDVNVDKPTQNDPTIDPPVIKEDKNDIKRKEIEKRFGIKILYGDEIGSYKPKRVNPVKLTDENEITSFLSRLNTELAKYPNGFFNDFNKKGMPLTIYLIKSANGVFSGFTDYEFMNNIKMTLATDFNFEYTLHHEMMHYIDCYLNIVMYPNTPYTEYEKLNPVGFSYGNAKENEIYNMANNTRGAYFISKYGSTYVNEDRAEVFKYMMARAYAPVGCFEAGETLNKKAKVISNQIKTYFPSVNGAANWDRFIK